MHGNCSSLWTAFTAARTLVAFPAFMHTHTLTSYAIWNLHCGYTVEQRLHCIPLGTPTWRVAFSLYHDFQTPDQFLCPQSNFRRVGFFISQKRQSKFITLVVHLTLLSSRTSYLSEAHGFWLCYSSEAVQEGNKWPGWGVSIFCTIMVCGKDSILWPTEFRASVLWSRNTSAVPWLGECLSLCHIPIAQHNQRQTVGTQHTFIKWLQHLLAPNTYYPAFLCVLQTSFYLFSCHRICVSRCSFLGLLLGWFLIDAPIPLGELISCHKIPYMVLYILRECPKLQFKILF